MWTRACVVVLTVTLTVVGAAGATSTSLAVTTAPAATVPTAFRVTSGIDYIAVACGGADTCFAVGETNKFVGILTPASPGSTGRSLKVNGTGALSGIACPTTTLCIAIGQWLFPATTAVVVAIRHGRPGKPEKLRGLFLFGIGCGSTDSCWATGETDNLRHALLVHIVGGRVAHTYVLKGIPAAAFAYSTGGMKLGLTADPGPPPDCYSVTACVAGTSTGNWKNDGTGLVVSFQNGRITRVLTVPRTARIVGLHCVNAGNCTALADKPHDSQFGSVFTLRDGQPSPLVSTVPIAGGAREGLPSLNSMACDTAACFGFDSMNAILKIVDGQPTALIRTHGNIGLVGCGTSACVGIGGKPGSLVSTFYAFS